MNTQSIPQVRKAQRIVGKTLVFRNAVPADAAFILTLRTDPDKSRHLSYTPSELNKQEAWLEAYAKKNDEAYFIIESYLGEPLGTVRIYDPQGDSFCWGSWLLKDTAPNAASIESALMVYTYAIDHLGFSRAHVEIRKGNKSVLRFHERFGGERVGETAQGGFHYQISLEKIMASRQRYKKYLPDKLEIVEWHEN